MNPGRIVGLFLGVLILIASFVLPFSFDRTFYDLSLWTYNNIHEIQKSDEPGLIALAYLTMVSFLLLVIAGIVGIFPWAVEL
jgi:ABC-type Na+ efflux pump permease subunit